MSNTKLCAADMAEVCARLINGEKHTTIRHMFKMGDRTIASMVERLRKFGIVVQPPASTRLKPEQVDHLNELFGATALSNREISARTGISRNAVEKYRERFNVELVQTGGELPRCACGQYLHHPRLCFVRVRQMRIERGITTVRTLPEDLQAEVHERLMRGETLRSVAGLVGLKRTQIAGFVRSLSAEERDERNRAFRTKAGRRRAATLQKRIERPHATTPATDPLYARISAAVPRGIDPALRDDMISQAYLEVLEGRLKEECLVEGVRKVRGRIFQAFANPWGNVSLDAVLDDEGGRAMIERIPAGASAFI